MSEIYVLNYSVYQKKLEDFKISRILTFYQNISKAYLCLSVLISYGLSNNKNTVGKMNPEKRENGLYKPHF